MLSTSAILLSVMLARCPYIFVKLDQKYVWCAFYPSPNPPREPLPVRHLKACTFAEFVRHKRKAHQATNTSSYFFIK